MVRRGTTGLGGVVASPLMPGARVREDGWTAVRVTKFLAVLAETGCVTDAARLAGISTKSVLRARKRYPAFDKACHEARGAALRGLEAVAYQRAVAGKETIIIRKGQEVERRISPSDAILKLLIQRGDMTGSGNTLGPVNSRGEPLGPDDYITAEEDAAGWRWIGGEKQIWGNNPQAKLSAKICDMRDRLLEAELEEGHCQHCHQPLAAEVGEAMVKRQAAMRARLAAEYGEYRGR